METRLVLSVMSLSTSAATKDGEFLVDYSKNIITEDTMKLLFDLVSWFAHAVDHVYTVLCYLDSCLCVCVCVCSWWMHQ